MLSVLTLSSDHRRESTKIPLWSRLQAQKLKLSNTRHSERMTTVGKRLLQSSGKNERRVHVQGILMAARLIPWRRIVFIHRVGVKVGPRIDQCAILRPSILRSGQCISQHSEYRTRGGVDGSIIRAWTSLVKIKRSDFGQLTSGSCESEYMNMESLHRQD